MKLINDKSFGVIPVHKIDYGNLLFLLVYNKAGCHWGFPKGHQVDGESEEETARRELSEETGINNVEFCHHGDKIQHHKNTPTRQAEGLVEQYRFETDGKIFDKTVTYFVGFVSDIKIKTPKDFVCEITDIRWVNYTEALALLTHDSTKQLLCDVNDWLKS